MSRSYPRRETGERISLSYYGDRDAMDHTDLFGYQQSISTYDRMARNVYVIVDFNVEFIARSDESSDDDTTEEVEEGGGDDNDANGGIEGIAGYDTGDFDPNISGRPRAKRRKRTMRQRFTFQNRTGSDSVAKFPAGAELGAVKEGIFPYAATFEISANYFWKEFFDAIKIEDRSVIDYPIVGPHIHTYISRMPHLHRFKVVYHTADFVPVILAVSQRLNTVPVVVNIGYRYNHKDTPVTNPPTATITTGQDTESETPGKGIVKLDDTIKYHRYMVNNTFIIPPVVYNCLDTLNQCKILKRKGFNHITDAVSQEHVGDVNKCDENSRLLVTILYRLVMLAGKGDASEEYVSRYTMSKSTESRTLTMRMLTKLNAAAPLFQYKPPATHGDHDPSSISVFNFTQHNNN